jgi:hypothetical protein
MDQLRLQTRSIPAYSILGLINSATYSNIGGLNDANNGAIDLTLGAITGNHTMAHDNYGRIQNNAKIVHQINYISPSPIDCITISGDNNDNNTVQQSAQAAQSAHFPGQSIQSAYSAHSPGQSTQYVQSAHSPGQFIQSAGQSIQYAQSAHSPGQFIQPAGQSFQFAGQSASPFLQFASPFVHSIHSVGQSAGQSASQSVESLQSAGQSLQNIQHNYMPQGNYYLY